MTESDPSAIDLAKDGGTAGDFFDLGGFPETEFPHPLAKVALTLQLHHQAQRTRGELAKRH